MPGSVVRAARPLDELQCLRRKVVVGVDLVSYQGPQVRPGTRVAGAQLLGQRMQGIDAPLVVIEWGGGTAGSKDDSQGVARSMGTQHAHRPWAGQRPDLLPVQCDLVRHRAAGDEAAQGDDGVVMVSHAEGPIRRRVLAGLHADRAGAVGLHPDRRRGLVQVTQHGAEHQ